MLIYKTYLLFHTRYHLCHTEGKAKQREVTRLDYMDLG